MFLLAVLTVGAVVSLSNAFTPAVEVTCSVGPSYSVALTGGSNTGVIFIDGLCETQSTTSSAGTYVFDAAACTTSAVPALGSPFSLVVQEYSTINLQTDLITVVTCNLDTGAVTQTVGVDATDDINACSLTEEVRQQLGLTCTGSRPLFSLVNMILVTAAILMNVWKEN